MNLEVIEREPHDARNGISPNGIVSNGSRLLSVNNKPKNARLSQPRPSVWTLKDVQKVIPKEGPSSLFIFRESNPIRKYAKLVAESKAFDYFILFNILFNCIVLAIDAPLPENDKSNTNNIAVKIEFYFLAIFSLEAIVKIVAMGFVLHPRSYLRSGWNILDFTVVIAGTVTFILELLPGESASNYNIKSLRAVRVLRPLKLISGIPSLQVVMTSVVRAMFPLMQVLFLVIFVIIIYAIIGLEFLRGRFRWTCYNKATNQFEDTKTPCDPKFVIGGNSYISGKKCPAGFTCTKNWVGPNSGITSFDNIFLAMLTVFQCITMEGWTETMYNKWIGNHNAKLKRKKTSTDCSPAEVPNLKRRKGERKLTGQNVHYSRLSKEGKLQGFESIAERNVFVSNQWHQLSPSERESCCEEARRKNEVAVEEITQCEKAELIKKHKKKLLVETSKKKSRTIPTKTCKMSTIKPMTFYAIDTHGYIYSFYYTSLIVIGSFFMLNLVLGVLSGEFAKEREKVENRRSFLKLRQNKQIERQYDGYVEWIMKGEEVMAQETTSRDSTSSPKDSADRIADASLNPAVVFTKNRYKFNSSSSHRKSKFDRIKDWIKLSRIKIRVLVKHTAFYWTVLVMVFLNTMIVATNHYEQPKWLDKFQEISELVFVTIFTAEMLLKLYGLGPKMYFHSMFNIFDCVVVNLSILEIIIGLIFKDFDLGLSVMRSLRLLRIFKVTKYWSSLRNLISSLMNGMKSILSLMFLLFLFIVISALLGMQLFGGRFAKFVDYPRTNFDTFPESVLAVFQIMTGEDWNAVMYNGVNAYKGPKAAEGVLSSLYFVLLVIFGNYTLLNVFLAIAVDNLTNAEILSQDEEDEQDILTRQRTARAGFSGPGTHWTKLKALSFVRTLQKRVEDDEMREASERSVLSNSATSSENEKIRKVVNGFADKRQDNQIVSAQIQKKWNKILQQQNSVPIVMENENAINEDQNMNFERSESIRSNTQAISNGDTHDGDGASVDKIIREEGLLNVLKTNVAERRRIQKPNPAFREISLFIFTQENPIRRFCHAVVHHRFFDPFIMGVIFISSLTLAIEDPLRDDNPRNKVLQYFDYVFAAIFSIEAILKIIDVGLILHKGAYFRSLWNLLDFFVVACNVASIFISLQHKSSKMGQTIKALRVLRVFRPLKAISKIKKLKAVFQCMVFSLKNVAFVLIITLLFLFIFACIGVQLFKGKFSHCTDTSKMTQEDCHGKYYDFPSRESVIQNKPNVKERKWTRYDFHFDNVFEAMLTLYSSSTGEGWPSSMHRTIDATKPGSGPIRNNNPTIAIYFVVFVIVFTFMIINIYVALIILTFQRQGEKELTEGGLDRNQRDCIHFALTCKAKPRYMPTDKHSFSYRVWYVVDSRPFEYCIMLFIFLNTLQLMMQYEGSSETYTNVLAGLNITFTVLFCMEALLKIVAYHLSYFRDLWNVFDCFVVLGSVLDIVLMHVPTITKVFDPKMFRLCRAARIVKLLRTGASIRLMLWTFLQSFKALPYVTALILLLFYMYAVIGMQMFSKIAYGDVITEYNNFRGIIEALQVLFRSATGESWNSIMYACYNEAPCDALYTTEKFCGNKYLAIFYFGTFIFLCMFLLLNLFVAVIMDNFEYLTRDSSILGPHHLDEFVRVWSEYDPGASGRIHHKLLYTLMCHMAPPVGFGKKCPRSLAYKRLIRMNMPVCGDQTVTFHSTLFALIRTSLDIKLKGNMFKNDQELRKAIQTIWPNMPEKNVEKILPKQTAASGQQMTVGKIYCVKLLVTNYRTTKAKEDIVVNEEEPEQGTPSVFKRIISSFRRRGSRRRSSPDEEAFEMTLKPTDVVKPHDTVKRTRTLSLKRSDNKGQGQTGQLTREGRRRSSWHDLGSFFRQKEGAPLEGGETKLEGAENADGVAQGQGAQGQATVIQNRNATSRGSSLNSSQNSLARTFSSGSTAGSTASQLTPGSRQQQGNYRSTDVNRNGMVRFSNNRDPHHRGARTTSSGSGYSGGKPVTRSYSAGAADYQRANLQQYRTDPRSVASPNYSKVPSSSSRQHYSNSLGSSTPQSSMHGLANNSSSQQSIHSLPNPNVASSMNNLHSNHSAPQTRSAPTSLDANINDYRSPALPSHQGKQGNQVWHSGPPFYGPPNSIDPANLSQSGRSASVPRTTGAYPPPNSQAGYAQAHSHGMRQGSSRPPISNSNDNDQYMDHRGVDRSRMSNHSNQPPMGNNRVHMDQNRNPSMANRQGGQASKAPYEEEEEILNGRQTQQYYDQMIAQINDKIAKAVERGQSPYAVYAANDDEESDWC